MPYWRLFYHAVWTTYRREPLIVPDLEQELFGYLTGKVVALGAIVHQIGGVEDHVHLVFSAPPKVSLAGFIGHLKGSSAHHLNHLPGAAGNFGWQDDYGVISFSEKFLPDVVKYVAGQREHHRTGRLWPLLEETVESEKPAPGSKPAGKVLREPEPGYLVSTSADCPLF